MTLSQREKEIALISSCITTFSIKLEEGELSPNQSIIDFISRMVPHEYENGIGIDKIEEVMEFISNLNMRQQ